MSTDTPETPQIHGTYCLAVLDGSLSENYRDLTLDLIEEHLRNNPRLLAIVKRLGERSLPLTTNPFFSDDNEDWFSNRVINLHIPEDDPEAVAYFDEAVAKEEIIFVE